jgi:hypothetical protein
MGMLMATALPYNLVPCFGRWLLGTPAKAAVAVVAVVNLWDAYAVYKLRPAGWWVAMVLPVVWLAAAALTFARVGPPPLDQWLADMPQQQFEMLRQTGMLQNPVLWLGGALPILVLAGYTRKFFPQEN